MVIACNKNHPAFRMKSRAVVLCRKDYSTFRIRSTAAMVFSRVLKAVRRK